MKLKILSLLFLILGNVAFAQVQFDAEVSKKKLGVNERLRVDFKMNEDGDNFKPPSFKGFREIQGPMQSVSTNVVIGAKSSRSYSKTYSYILQPTARGKFTIGQAEITIDGETYKTMPVEIEVTAAVEDSEEARINNTASENIHLVAEVSKGNPYLNEAVTVTYKLYVSPSISVSNFREIDSPTFSDFWSQNVLDQPSRVQTGEYNGRQYRYVTLRKVVLYPQKSGVLELEPLMLSVAVDVPTGERNFFGGRVYTTVDKTITAGKRAINVKPLPQEGRPADFAGAVGRNLNLEVSATKNTLKTGESFEAKVEVEGNGNLKLFNLPSLKLHQTLEVYEPEHQEDVRVSTGGMNGSVSNTYTVVPSRKGKYTIPELSFSYFDLDSQTYKSITSGNIEVDVEQGAAIRNSPPTPGTNRQQAVEITGTDFRFIKLKTNLEPIDKQAFFNSPTFWTLFLAPFVAIPLVVLFGKRREAKANDVHGNRIKKANKLARKYLSEAKKNLGDQKAFYISLERALHNYLKAKLHIQISDMSKENIQAVLEEKNVSTNDISAFLELVKSYEIARYTPSSNFEMEQDYNKAVSVISALDKQL